MALFTQGDDSQGPPDVAELLRKKVALEQEVAELKSSQAGTPALDLLSPPNYAIVTESN